jgi:isopenicillin N synthase-like dioxygenase
MDKWGNLMHNAVQTLAEMLAIGFGLPQNTFSDMAKYGPHLLAPTGSDLSRYGKVGTVLAGFHQDLNFLTIHGKSRFPGLNIWAKDGQKLLAKVTDGCLLVQAGKQMEYLTGGKVLAGYHEVAVAQSTLKAMEIQSEKNRPLWLVLF